MEADELEDDIICLKPLEDIDITSIDSEITENFSKDMSMKDQPDKTTDFQSYSAENSNTSENAEKDSSLYPVSRRLKRLSFATSGKFLENWNPATSQREARKIRQKSKIEKSKTKTHKSTMYDEIGIRIKDNSDICDCLIENCPGCHFPCFKCGSQKCGSFCRCSRRWNYTQVEVEGTQYLIVSRQP